MLRLSLLARAWIILAAFLLAAPNAYTADAVTPMRAAPTEAPKPVMPVAPSETATPAMPLGNKAMSAGCCKAPGPDGLHCCDTRDCGWFDCGDSMMLQQKKFKPMH